MLVLCMLLRALKRELYGGQYPDPLKSFIDSVSRHPLSKLFQFCTGHGVLGKYFRKRGIKERNRNCATRC